ncbi:MAG: hypothetical protein Q9M36_07100 [Sulfurovum sp.]|nr:hypothetical protein [Sulfurovum sp.]
MFDTPIAVTPTEEAPALDLGQALDDSLLFDTPIAVTPTEEAPALDLGQALDDSLLFDTPIAVTPTEEAPALDLAVDVVDVADLVDMSPPTAVPVSPVDNSEILIDVEEVSQKIGISP